MYKENKEQVVEARTQITQLAVFMLCQRYYSQTYSILTAFKGSDRNVFATLLRHCHSQNCAK